MEPNLFKEQPNNFIRLWGRISLIAILFCGFAVITSCNPDIESSGNSRERFDRTKWAVLDSNPDAHKGAFVEIVGKVFTNPDKTATGTSWQMWADPKNSNWNTGVVFQDPNFAIKNGDIVRVTGTVRGAFTGTNAFGAKISAPVIDADSATVVDALAIASTPLHTVNVNQTLKQHDLAVIVEKLEFAEDETRVFLKVINGTKHKGSFYSFNAKAQQGNKQYDAESFSDYPKIQSDLLPGVESVGVIPFPAMGKEPTKLIFEARTDNYWLNFKPYIFDIKP